MESIEHLQSIHSIQVNEDTTLDIQAMDANHAAIQSDGSYHVIVDGVVVPVRLKATGVDRTYTCMIDQIVYHVRLQRVIDQIVQSMGYDLMASRALESIIAPMPGLVKKIHVSIGDDIVKGQSLITLEAMKMENIIKSPNGGKIKGIHTQVGKAVEKNEILISF